MTKTMKALQLTGYGKLSAKLKFQDCLVPVYGEHDVLIKVKAAGINPIDYKMVKGYTRILRKIQFPATIGYDVAGVVQAVGAKVSRFKAGDEVFASVDYLRQGTIAEYAVALEGTLALKPSNLSFIEAASIPLVGLTSYQAFQLGQLKAGQKVLIHAGSGGVGTFAIQYAKALGAIVYTTTSTKNVEWVKHLGADRVFDYTAETYLDHLSEIDFVYDTVGKHYTSEAFQVLKQGGAVINLPGPFIDRQSQIELGLSPLLRPVFALLGMQIKPLIKKKKALYRFLLMDTNGNDLEQIARFIEAGKIKAVIDSVYKFEEAILALEKLKNGHAKGKIVITME
ncbi:MAG: NADP-dependent oxidoreductase [Prolixibacteraceae bacterium]|nr:NADP-dependent oxidoreductase [Prolixibacteraceae bacterium]